MTAVRVAEAFMIGSLVLMVPSTIEVFRRDLSKHVHGLAGLAKLRPEIRIAVLLAKGNAILAQDDLRVVVQNRI